MEFAFTADQQAITEAVRELLIDTCQPADIRRLLDSGAALDTARWQAICEMGLPGICAPENAGGLGMELVDLVGIAEAAGYVALPEPLVEQAGIVVPLLAALEDDRGWLARVMGGEIVALGHPANPLVGDADSAWALLLADGEDLHLVEAGTVRLTRRESFDPCRRLFAVDWTPSAATRVGSGWSDTTTRAAILTAAQMIGIAQRSIDMAVAYAKDRMQFGRAIGSQQAVKHLLANAQVKVEFARPVVYAAAAELPLASPAARVRAAHAKIVAAEAVDLATRNAVQVHGAMGMTWEVDLHFWVKRGLALQRSWGTHAAHLETIMARLATLPTGPEFTFATEVAL